ncbi:Aerobic glycerol-3-phosphate dehydrogenase [invertebrate metagenome]|uniref:Aerobic glycerol-3-phosphate dehydrogenase n=1 Tax=invertebrate metagenome TaxID=1711999 RepID=A0A2H9TB24_9ZZZZ
METNIMHRDSFDLFVIGGGINGVGIAADAAGRGLKTGLCEQGDLGGGTSSNSTKLIHGGLRYLEHYEFRMVKEALAERDVLSKIAPHITWPMRFCLPHRPGLRPAWMVRAGLFLYDHLNLKDALPGSHGVCLGHSSPLQDKFTRGFEYSDVWVDDARLVVLNALQAKKYGASIHVQSRAVNAVREKQGWRITIHHQADNSTEEVTAKVLVNAAGPWVASVYDHCLKRSPPRKIRLVKGSHIIVHRFHDDLRSYILQHDDKRIVFVIPYLKDYSLIGTTDIAFMGDPYQAKCSGKETDYLCHAVNQHFKQRISPEKVIHSYSGVRPLMEDESAALQKISRDYTITREGQGNTPPLLSVFGGKLTTYRKLSEQVVDKVSDIFPTMGESITKKALLPGGDGVASVAEWENRLLSEYPWLPEMMARRFGHCYGSLVRHFLQGKQSVDSLGHNFGHGLTQSEVDYLVKHEWAQNADDILWRRTKLGLMFSDEEVKLLVDYLVGLKAHKE